MDAKQVLACLADVEERKAFTEWAAQHEPLYVLTPELALMIWMIGQMPCPICKQKRIAE